MRAKWKDECESGEEELESTATVHKHTVSTCEWHLKSVHYEH